jgi:hypothetical protein
VPTTVLIRPGFARRPGAVRPAPALGINLDMLLTACCGARSPR